MGTNRTRTQRTRKASTPLDETIKNFLFFGLEDETPRNSAGWSLRVSRFFDGSEIQDAWTEHRAELMAEWQRTGRRGLPWAAQQFDKKERN